jgi:transposase InsO family protein
MVPVSRRGFYRSLQEQRPIEEEMEARSAIQQIALDHRRRYGYRRITAELHRRGMLINHKRVVRIMREDNLLGLQPKRLGGQQHVGVGEYTMALACLQSHRHCRTARADVKAG